MRKPSEPTSKDHRRFEYEAADELWLSDVMYGPKIREQRQLRRTYLIALLDDATRRVRTRVSCFQRARRPTCRCSRSRRMSMAALDALAQRIVVRANVRGLSRDETEPYLAHRLKLAGC